MTISYSSAGVARWTNRYHGPVSGDNGGYAIAVEPNGSRVFVAGYSPNIGVVRDFLTLAYDGNTGTIQWTNRYNEVGQGVATALGLALSATGSVFVGGTVGFMQTHYATVAYSPTGLPLWTNLHYGPRGGGNFEAITSANGSVYVTGFADGQTSDADYATVAYSTGGVAIWTNRYNGPANAIDTPLAIAADLIGQVYVTGYSQGNGTEHNYATIAYSSLGQPLWTNRYNGTGNNSDIAYAVAVDNQGQIYVTGASYNSGGNFEYATIAYSTTGVGLWTNRYKAPGPFDSAARTIACDGTGKIVVSGYSDASVSGRDVATVAYSSDGTPLWTNRYNGPVNGSDYINQPFCIAMGPAGSVYVTGISDGTSYPDYATIKYVPAPDIRFTMIQALSDGSYRLRLSASTNFAFRLEASDDLSNWLTLTNFPPLPQSRILYTDKMAPSFPCRFYRTVWHP